MFSLICAWINGCVNNREACDLRRHRAHYYVTVMNILSLSTAYFFCANGEPVPIGWTCDGQPDCSYGEDETDMAGCVSKWTCTEFSENGWHPADDISKCFTVTEDVFHLNFFPMGPVVRVSDLVQIAPLCLSGDKFYLNYCWSRCHNITWRRWAAMNVYIFYILRNCHTQITSCLIKFQND